MTGEMSYQDLYEDGEWGHMVKLAKVLGGVIRPFDQYQGPYITLDDDNGVLHELWQQGDAKIYDKVRNSIILLPHHWYLSDDQIYRAAETIKNTWKENAAREHITIEYSFIQTRNSKEYKKMSLGQAMSIVLELATTGHLDNEDRLPEKQAIEERAAIIRVGDLYDLIGR